MSSLLRTCVCVVVVAGGASASDASGWTAVALYDEGGADVEQAFRKAYDHFADTFDYDLFARSVSGFNGAVGRYNATRAYDRYARAPTLPHCDVGGAVLPKAAAVGGVAAFPGGAVASIFGTEFGKGLLELSGRVKGPDSAALLAPLALSHQALATGVGLVQATVAAMLHVVPPLVPPPAWNNQPLSCVPMVAGHRCFGSVSYPITMADFMLADVTDTMLDGYVAGFPSLYAKKVGKTTDAMYRACFASYMSMMCSSVFPRCTTPQSRDELVPVGGSVPVCLHMCVLPLVMCPGLWMSDLLGSCSTASVPPMCSQASFDNTGGLPSQYASFDEAHPFEQDCPETSSTVADADLRLFEVSERPQSPIERAAVDVKALPEVADAFA